MNRILGTLLAMVFVAGPVWAQGDAPPRPGVPDIPGGPGAIAGRVVHRDANQGTAGIPVGLYSLAPDGQPSLRETTTDADGLFRFDNISNSPRTIYLISARSDDIPYGKRATFAPDQTELEVVLEVANPTSDTRLLRVSESRIDFSWQGDQLLISENHAVVNDGERVVRAADGRTSSPPLEVGMPASATAFNPGYGQLPNHFEQRGDRLLYWGPIYPGENTIGFSYRIAAQPGENDSTSFTYSPNVVPAPEAIVLLVLESDPEPKLKGLAPGAPIEASERTYRTYRSDIGNASVPPELVLSAPLQRSDRELLRIRSANVWLELDDSVLDVRIDYTLDVEGEASLVGSEDAPLLRLEIPGGAELLGAAPRTGLAVSGAGNSLRINVVGPLPAGESPLSIHYRVASAGDSAEIDLGFPGRLPVLNVLVADTGLTVESDRLHRRRPTRVGTRLYLHREAFQVEAGERVPLRLQAVSRVALPRSATRIAVLAVAVLALFFIISPLRAAAPTRAASTSADAMRNERESLYESIRDLEHDFETGKLSDEDRVGLRKELEARAATLFESQTQKPATAPAPPATCPGCGGRTEPAWKFCSHCGGPL